MLRHFTSGESRIPAAFSCSLDGRPLQSSDRSGARRKSRPQKLCRDPDKLCRDPDTVPEPLRADLKPQRSP